MQKISFVLIAFRFGPSVDIKTLTKITTESHHFINEKRLSFIKWLYTTRCKLLFVIVKYR